MKNKDVFKNTWQGVDIEITCDVPNYISSYRKIYGYEMHHIEVRSISPENAPLPITETGYRSIFITEPELSANGGVLKYMTNYIEQEAKSKKWIAQQEKSRQFTLF